MVLPEVFFRVLVVGGSFRHFVPELWSVSVRDQMAQFVYQEVFEHFRRRHDKSPAYGNGAFGGAASPSRFNLFEIDPFHERGEFLEPVF